MNNIFKNLNSKSMVFNDLISYKDPLFSFIKLKAHSKSKKYTNVKSCAFPGQENGSKAGLHIVSLVPPRVTPRPPKHQECSPNKQNCPLQQLK